jgi:hypothetical protein
MHVCLTAERVEEYVMCGPKEHVLQLPRVLRSSCACFPDAITKEVERRIVEGLAGFEQAALLFLPIPPEGASDRLQRGYLLL